MNVCESLREEEWAGGGRTKNKQNQTNRAYQLCDCLNVFKGHVDRLRRFRGWERLLLHILRVLERRVLVHVAPRQTPLRGSVDHIPTVDEASGAVDELV